MIINMRIYSFTAPNQVTTFLKRHGGPGIQHIGLSTDKLVEAVGMYKNEGVAFLQPPKEYYNEVRRTWILLLAINMVFQTIMQLCAETCSSKSAPRECRLLITHMSYPHLIVICLCDWNIK